jgi:hypothetical protein
MTQYFNAGLKNQFTDIILGAKDGDKTEELPSRDKMSKVTMDMAAIYQKILNNDLTGEGFDDGDYSASPSASDSSMASTPVSAAALTPAKGATGTWDMSRVVGEDVAGTPVSRRPPPRPSSILRNSSTKKPSQSVEKLRSFRESFGSAVGSPGLNMSAAGSPGMYSDTMAFNLAMESPVAEKTKPLEGITCLSDFLQACGLAYLDSSNAHLRPKARDSSIGLVRESQGEWPPTDAADFLEACLVTKLEVDYFGKGCLELVDAKADIEPNLKQMEEWLNTTQPALFKSVAPGAKSAEAVAEKMQRVLDKSRLEAKSQWTQWRLQLAVALRNALRKNLTQSESDLGDLEGLLDEVTRIHMKTCTVICIYTLHPFRSLAPTSPFYSLRHTHTQKTSKHTHTKTRTHKTLKHTYAHTHTHTHTHKHSLEGGRADCARAGRQ